MLPHIAGIVNDDQTEGPWLILELGYLVFHGPSTLILYRPGFDGDSLDKAFGCSLQERQRHLRRTASSLSRLTTIEHRGA